MFSHVWSSARFKHCSATMISIEGLLEDEQGLSMGEMLTVKIRQPSHEFTFGVGISFIPYPLVLTPWYNKFTCACRFWSLVFMQDFNVECKTFGMSSSSTLWQDLEAPYKSCNEANLTPRSQGLDPRRRQTPRTWPEKCWILQDMELCPIRRENDDMDLHAEGGNIQEAREPT
jgi:hypothetical protein